MHWSRLDTNIISEEGESVEIVTPLSTGLSTGLSLFSFSLLPLLPSTTGGGGRTIDGIRVQPRGAVVGCLNGYVVSL